MRESDERDWVAEKNWRKRTEILRHYPGVPKEVSREFFEIKRAFGIDIANLVIRVHSLWGPKVAKTFAKTILGFNSFEDLIQFLEKKIDMFSDESRERISSMIRVYRYRTWMEKLREYCKSFEANCRGVTDLSLKIYHALAVHGYFYKPECIVRYAMFELKCVDDPTERCRDIFQIIDTVVRRSGK